MKLNKERLCSLLAIIVFCFFASGSTDSGSGTSSNSKSSVAKQPRQTNEEKCGTDLSCLVDRITMSAGFKCVDYVEKMAKYNAKWTDGMLEPKFSHARWKDKQNKIITAIGDKVQFQNGFGAYQNYIYECDLDIEGEVVYDVRASPGKL